jgi:multiple sugar transport system permease protein
MTASEKRNLRNGLLFTSPWLVGLAVFVLYPVGASFYYSFCDYSVLKPPVWVGLGNYREMLSDQVLWTSVWNTTYFAVISIVLTTIMSLAAAVLLNSKVRGMAFYRTFFFLPSLIPMVAAAILWQWIFNGNYGVLNHFLSLCGFKFLPAWLNDSRWAMPALIVMSLWGIGNTIVIYLAGLQDVPEALYEAAEIDGAGYFRRVWHITIPMLSPVIYFNTVMSVIGALQVFAVPYIMTAGGPGRSTTFYAMYLYETSFQDLRMGYGCAMAWVLFIVILVLTLIITKLSARHIHYGEGA